MSATRGLDDCGACEGIAVATPLVVHNRPGLSAIAYRVGAHADFLQSLLAGLSDARRPALAGLNTRDPDDFTVALLDSWAMVADVLTFYQERIANEGYLRTCTERASVLELARLIGYELRPGVAAGTVLAFTLDEAPGAPASVKLDPGIKVNSVPGPGEKPQTWETVESIEGRPTWNVLRPRLTEPQVIASSTGQIWLAGTTTNLHPGDALLVADAPAAAWDLRKVETVQVDPAAKRTRVTWGDGLGWRSFGAARLPADAGQSVYALRLRTGLFGGTAPDWRTMPKQLKNGYLGITPDDQDPPPYTEWPGFTLGGLSDPPETTTGSGLFGEYWDHEDFSGNRVTRLDPVIDFNWGGGSPAGGIGVDNFSVRWSGWVAAPSDGSWVFFVNADDGVRLWVGGQLVVNDWSLHPLHTPGAIPRSAPILMRAGRKVDITIEYFEEGGAAAIQLSWAKVNGDGTVPAPDVIASSFLFPRYPDTVHLEGKQPGITADSWLVLTTPDATDLYSATSVAESSRTAFTMSGKTTRLQLAGDNLFQHFNDRLRDTTVYAQSEQLPLSERPLAGWTGEGRRPPPQYLPQLELTLDRLLDPPLPAGRRLVISGFDEDTGARRVEEATLLESSSYAGTTVLRLSEALLGRYHIETVEIRANVAAATHGETVANEVLGSGDASLPHQRFTLRQGPLTHVAAANETGAESTLTVTVDDVRWTEVPTLHDRGPKERVYVTRTDDAGKTTVEFGDGHEGARLPAGSDNVVAGYRKGIGREGEVKADQLTLLLARPLGVRAAMNPLPGLGAQDRQSLEDARVNAPPTVITLGRIVSLADFEDYAQAFAGIGKAMASWVWTGDARGVLLTVAGLDGAPVASGSNPHDALVAAIRKAAEPTMPVFVVSYRSAAFTIDADLRVEGDRKPDKVLAAVQDALAGRFSFAARSFGQAVTVGEVVSVIQKVPGVTMVDVNRILRSPAPAPPLPSGWPADNLPALLPRPGDSIAGLGAADLANKAAELLTIALPVGGIRVVT